MKEPKGRPSPECPLRRTLEKGKKTDNPREGWEDGTPPPHRDFKERSVALAIVQESCEGVLF